MTNTAPDLDEIPDEFKTLVRRSFATAVRLETLFTQALAVGFEPGFARQLAALAAETEKTTGAPAEQFITSTANMAAAERLTGRDLYRYGQRYPNPIIRALTRARSAYRHAVKFARGVLLRQY